MARALRDHLDLGAIARPAPAQIHLLQADHIIGGDLARDLAQNFMLGGGMDHLPMGMEQVIPVAPGSDPGLNVPCEEFHETSSSIKRMTPSSPEGAALFPTFPTLSTPLLIHIVVATVLSLRVLYRKLQVNSALAWIVVLIAMPIGLFLMMLHMKPDYVSLLWTDPMGIQMSVGAIILMIIGSYCIKKIVDIKV